MALEFKPFEQNLRPAVEAFNQRMQEGRAPTDFLLPLGVHDRRASSDDPIQWTQYLVLDGPEVRGGVLAMDQPGWIDGHEVRAWNFQSPLSEGIVNSKYAIVAMQLVKFMQKRADVAFVVGMGAADRPLPRLLAASGWSVRPVPFLFRVHRASVFLRELQMLRTSSLKRLGSRAARITGLGAAGLALVQRRRCAVNGSIRQVSAWGDWADEIWRRCRDECSFAVQRDRRTLESLYPLSDSRTKIFLIERDRRPVGWSVCFNAALSNHRHFGSLQLASILDCMADPEAMATTSVLTDNELASQGADLVVVNHSHAAWVRSFRLAGFLNGPSNYLLAMSKRMTELIRAQPVGEQRAHVTRGDGDGRIHLA